MTFEMAGVQWIWVPKHTEEDQYADFVTEMILEHEPVDPLLTISADSDYAVWINGKYVDAGHYDDFPQNRTHDRLSVKDFLVQGRNRIAVLAYYQGRASHQYFPGSPGLIFMLTDEAEVLAISDSGTECRPDPVFRTGNNPLISQQIGFTFDADGRNEDGWRNPGYSGREWRRASVMTGEGYSRNTRERPIKKLKLKPRIQAEIVAQGKLLHSQPIRTTAADRMQTDYLSTLPQHELFRSGLRDTEFSTEIFIGREPIRLNTAAWSDADGVYLVLDNGREEAGLFHLDIDAPEGIDVDIAWGQHLQDLRVRACIGGRHFAGRYTTRNGRQRFFFPFRRMGGRYIQIHLCGKADHLVLHYAGILPWDYPVEYRGAFQCPDSLHNRIWEVSRRTLELCMHEHYEDTPWREQAFYIGDSRNEALCGYYAFGEYSFPEATFKLYKEAFSSDLHADICAPSDSGLCIPAFVLNWPVTIYEQWMYSGSTSLAEACWPKVTAMLAEALSRVQDGLMATPSDAGMWNFYEWTEGMSGRIERDKPKEIRRLEAPLQFFLIRALQCASKLADALGDTQNAEKYRGAAMLISKRANEVFWQPDRGVYATFSEAGKQYHEAELTQALAFYCGAVPEPLREPLRQKLTGKNEMVPCSLSYSIYKYDALLQGGEQYAESVFRKIAEDWGKMLYKDSSSFWETILGAKDFGYAGSLCHGWSAIPMYLYGRYVLGVYPMEPGFKRFAVEPMAVFSSASGTVPTSYGDIRVTVECSGNGKRVDVDAPEELEWI